MPYLEFNDFQQRRHAPALLQPHEMSWSLDDLSKNGEKWDDLADGRMLKRLKKVTDAHDDAVAVLEGEKDLGEVDYAKELGGIPSAEQVEQSFIGKFREFGLEREKGTGQPPKGEFKDSFNDKY